MTTLAHEAAPNGQSYRNQQCAATTTTALARLLMDQQQSAVRYVRALLPEPG